MSKLRNLPEITTLEDADTFYVVDNSTNPNGGRKITKANLKDNVALTAAEVKSRYESNANTNAYTDAEKAKLAGIEPGATADQIASEVPFNNSGTDLSAANVQDAIAEVDIKSTASFFPSVSSGLILHYTAGQARFNDVVYSLAAGNILLDSNVTDGEAYLDVDGIVKHTLSGISAPPFSLVFARFSTDLNNIISLTDIRIRNTQNLVHGVIGDMSSVAAGNSASEGSSNRMADAAHVHAVSTGAPSTVLPDQANAEGTGGALARASHTHSVVTAAPTGSLSPSGTNTQGGATSFARSNHTHAISTALVADITTIQPDDAASAGTADNYARGDHKHAIAAAAPITQTPNQANAEGNATSFARSNHVHNIPTGTPSSTGTANSAGSAASFAASDHVHNTVIANSIASATADDTSTSLTDVVIAGMTLTPAAGTYLATFSSSVNNSGNGSVRLYVSVYASNAQIAHSERQVGIGGGANVPVHTNAIVTVDGTQAIEARWRAVAGTNTAHQRSLTLVRLG